MPRRSLASTAISLSLWQLVLLALIAGCGASHPTLAPTPVIYRDGRVDLATIVPRSARTVDTQIFYATNRSPSGSGDTLHYGNRVDDKLHLGTATVHIGDANTTWAEVCAQSQGTGGKAAFSLTRLDELATLAAPERFTQALERQLSLTANRQVNIYVHGFRTYLDWEVEILAKLFHFSARTGAMICFAWPSRQNLYLYGSDVDRGRASAHHLADLIETVAKSTSVDRINVLAYSCGATVATEALLQLRQRHADETPQQLSDQLRIGNLIFAASDIDLKTFAKTHLEQIEPLAQNVIVYMNSNDAALGLASLGYGASRLGHPNVAELGMTRAELEESAKQTRFQFVDVTDVPGPKSAGGLGGHGYWYANDWIMADLLVTFRWQSRADQRGLYQKKGMARWFFPADYPQRITTAVEKLGTPRPATAATPPGGG